MSEKPIISPSTKIRELIDAYPWLEEKLVDMAPEFRKLKNPVLRNTIARVTSLSQAARIGGVDINLMVNQLREAAGQATIKASAGQQENVTRQKPVWFEKEKIVATIDARPMLEAGQHPIGMVFTTLDEMQNGEILTLITGFFPAPLIDKAAEKAYQAYSDQVGANEYWTYFYRP